MSQRNVGWIGLLVVLAVVFLYAVSQLLLVRFTKGDVFPPYSSLRADPLGLKAYADSLDLVDGVTMQRHLLPFDRLEPEPGQTVIFAGVNRYNLQQTEPAVQTHFEQLVVNRSRALIALYPLTEPGTMFGIMMEEANRERHEEDEDQEEEAPEDAEAMPGMAPQVNMAEQLGVRIAEQKGDLPLAARLEAELDLPATLQWHSLLTFELPADSDWRVIYSAEGQPVLIERDLGTGTLVMASDSYFLSNEAMRQARQPRLLAWLIGDSRTVIFDESHLGVNQQPGVATLAREYGLHGAFFGLVLLAVLFIWRSTATFLPRREDGASGGVVDVEGDHTSGLVNVLRRHVRPRDLIPHCVAEWERSLSAHRPHVQAKAEDVRRLAASEDKPVSLYQRLAAMLNQRM